MISIAHISPTYYSPGSVVGGGEKYVVYLSKSLKISALELNKKVRNVIIAFGSQEQYEVFPDYDLQVLKATEWSTREINGGFLQNIISKFDIVFVHQCLSELGLFAAAQAKLVNKFVIGMDHGGGEHRLVNHSDETGNMFDLFCCQSNFAKIAFAKFKTEKIVALGPIDDDIFSLKSEVESYRDYRSILCVGRLLPHKGFERVVKALPDQARLCIVGSSYDEDYKKYLLKFSEGKNVEIINRMTDEELQDIYRKFGLFVHASTHVDYRHRTYVKPELLGLAPLEAMASGMPALVSDAGALSELGQLPGCVVFSDDDELSKILNVHCDGHMDWPKSSIISSSTSKMYGLYAFGDKIWKAISNFGENK